MLLTRYTDHSSFIVNYTLGQGGRTVLEGEGASISPNGRYIVFTNGRGDLGMADRYADWLISTIPWGGFQLSNPKWLPGTNMILYSLSPDPYDQLASQLQGFNRSTGFTAVDYPAAGESVLGFDISPDGNRIYVATRESPPRIRVLNGDGGFLRYILPQLAPAEGIEVSPDGRMLVYYGSPDLNENSNIYLMNSDGSGERLLIDRGTSVFRPVFSPSGRYLAYALIVSGEEPGQSTFETWIFDRSTGKTWKLEGISQRTWPTDWARSEPLTVYRQGFKGQRVKLRLYGKGQVEIKGPSIRPILRYLPVGVSTLNFRLRKKAKPLLKKKGHLRVAFRIRYSPTGGYPVNMKRTVDLRR